MSRKVEGPRLQVVRGVHPFVAIARLAAARKSEPLAAALCALEAPAAAIVDTLGRHTLIRQTLMTLGDGEAFESLPDELRDAFDRARHKRWPSTSRLLRVHAQASSALQKARVPVLLLKGFYLATRLYGGLEHRPQFDIDLLVPGRDFTRATRALEAAGFTRRGYDAHSRTLRLDGLNLDLHRHLVRAPVFRADERAWWDSAISVQIGEARFRTLSDELALVQLLHAAYEDVGQGAARLRQLVDLFLLVADLDRSLDWDAFFTARRAESFEVVAVNALALMTSLFGAAAEWPRLAAALDRRSAQIRPESIHNANGLIFTTRKHAANLEWFASLYPGSMPAYLAWFWFHGFPSNLAGLSIRRLATSVRLAARHRTNRQTTSGLAE